MARDLHRQLNFWVDVNAVKDTLLEGKLTGELHDVACEDETFTDIAGKRLADVFKHRRHHEVVRLVRAEVQLEDVAVLPNLDVPSGHT